MSKFYLSLLLTAATILAFVACGDSEAPASSSGTKQDGPKGFSEQYLLDAEPADFLPVKTIIGTAKDGEDVVVFGRMQDVVKGLGVFTFIDRSIPSCKESGCDCPTPWDFC
ncbi:MAG: hypothetical protein V3W41_16625 [Planctomycetota bacterium]